MINKTNSFSIGRESVGGLEGTMADSYWPRIESDGRYSFSLIVQNKLGLHARPATLICKTLSMFNGYDVYVGNGRGEVHAKSILSLLTLGASQGTTLTFYVDPLNGEGEEGARNIYESLRELFNAKFYEE